MKKNFPKDLNPQHLPAKVQALYAELEGMYQANDHEQLMATIRDKTSSFSDYEAWFLEVTARSYFKRGQLSLAIKALSTANSLFEWENVIVLGRLIAYLHDNREYDQALSTAQQGLAKHPKDSTLSTALALILDAKGQTSQALEVLRATVKDHPTLTSLEMLGKIAFDLGFAEEGLEAYYQATKLTPTTEAAFNNWIMSAHYLPGYDADKLHSMQQYWFENLCKNLPPTAPARLERSKDPQRPLRIGLLSAGFQIHPASWLTFPVVYGLVNMLKHEFYFYNTGPEQMDKDFIRQILKDTATVWREATHISQENLYQQMLDDNLDIAIDMAGYMRGGRLQLFSRRIAPIQIKWVGGLVNSTQVPNMDYLISDHVETPAGVDNYYSEKIIRLPYGYTCFTKPPYTPDLAPVPQVSNGYVTYGCFNNLHKVNTVLVEQWAKILNAVPESKLFLKTTILEKADIRQHVIDMFAQFSIPADRLILEGPATHKEMLESYAKVDLALDTWPYTGGLTTLEAMWMGVPVVTMLGPTFCGRHAATHIRNINAADLITNNFDNYTQLAIKLGQDLKTLSNLRLVLRSWIEKSPLMNFPQMTADLAYVLQTVWENYCAGKEPQAIDMHGPTDLMIFDGHKKHA